MLRGSPQRPSPKSMRATGTPSDESEGYALAPNRSSEAPATLTEKHAWRPVPRRDEWEATVWRPILLRSPSDPHRKAYLATGTQREMNGKLAAWRPKQNSQRTQCISPCRGDGASNERAGSY